MNVWIKENGEVIFCGYMRHEEGYSPKEIKYNETHWIKISDGNLINYDRKLDIISCLRGGGAKATRQQLNRIDLIIGEYYGDGS